MSASRPLYGLATVHPFNYGAYGIGAGSLSGILNVERQDVYNAAATVSNDMSFEQYDVKFFSTTPLLVTLAAFSSPELRITSSGGNEGAPGMTSSTSAGVALYQNGGIPVAYEVEGGSLNSFGYGNLPTGTSSASSFIVATCVNYDFVTYVIGQVSPDGTNLYHNSAYSIEGGGPSGHAPGSGSLHYQAASGALQHRNPRRRSSPRFDEGDQVDRYLRILGIEGGSLPQCPKADFSLFLSDLSCLRRQSRALL